MPGSIPNDIYQYSLISAYEAGLRTGGPPVAFLTNHGTHGTGIFADGDADMIQIDSKAYKLKDGKAEPASMYDQLPFVMVNIFQPTSIVKAPEGTSIAGLRQVFESKGLVTGGKNTPMPFAVTGTFKAMHLGSGPVIESISGTIFGYWIPSWQSEVSGKGIQCAFLSDDKKVGGRVTDFETQSGAKVEWAKCGRFHLGFPQDEQYESLNL